MIPCLRMEVKFRAMGGKISDKTFIIRPVQVKVSARMYISTQVYAIEVVNCNKSPIIVCRSFTMSPTPFVSRRAPIYADVPDEKWNDWRWQLSHRLNSVEDFEKVLPLTESERKALQHQRPVPGGYYPLLRLADRPGRSRRSGPPPGGPDWRRDRALYRHDGRLAGRRPPFPRARAWCTATPTGC